MDNTTSDTVILGVDMALIASVLWSLLLVVSLFTAFTIKVDEQETTRIRLEEYREHNGYDHTVVYSSDIVSAILKSKGDLEIKVNATSGTYTWNRNYKATNYTAAEINTVLDNTKLYDSEITYGGNDEVIGYEFTEKA